MTDLAVVVVAYRSADTLDACLTAILADPRAEIAVVDNAGDEATRQVCARLAAPDGRVTYLDPGRNLGYARAANLGLAALGDRKVVAVVNPDVKLTGRVGDLLVAAGAGADDVVAGRLSSPLHPDSVNARPATTAVRELAKAVVGTRAYRLRGLPPPDGTVHAVEQLDGALLVMHGSTWARLGGFDERFELYYEDVDLCARVRANGTCLLVNRPWGEHIGGHSYRRSAGTAYIAQRVSRVRYARSWWRPAPFAAPSVLVISLLEYAVRTITRQAEGQRTRNRALRLVLDELRQPGSQQVLQPTPTSTPGKEHEQG